MLTTERLKREFFRPKGDMNPKYWRGKAFLEHPDDPITLNRARTCVLIFETAIPHIYSNDLIVGSLVGSFIDIPQEEREPYEKEADRVGDRVFQTRSDHYAPDYWYVLEKGIPGMLADIDASLVSHAGEPEQVQMLTEMRMSLAAFHTMITHYREKAESLYGVEGYNKKQLDFIVGNLKQIETGAPQTFAQALQLVWLCHLAFCIEGRTAMALGRIDQYLYPFYQKDAAAGILSDDLATEFLENVFIKIYERNPIGYGNDIVNICIGGMSPDGSTDVNELSYCTLHAVKNCNVAGPNLSARISHSTPDEFLDDCLKTIGTGLGYPALMNDEANIPALSRYDFEEKDVYNYCMVGCIENFISGKQPPWTDTGIAVVYCIDAILNHGHSVLDGSVCGVDTGDISEIHSMDDFMKKMEIQLLHSVENIINSHNFWDFVRGDDKDFTLPFMSCFSQECIQRGKDLNNGGAKYPSSVGMCITGIATVADCLAAIEKTVFVDHTATLEEIRDALLVNYEGKEELRQLLLSAPKYGNNDDFVDKYAVWLSDFIPDEFYKRRDKVGGYFFNEVASNIGNIYLGMGYGASADGRFARQPVSDAASPDHGLDVNGITSTLLSCAKPHYTKIAGGTVVNQKLFPTMFHDGNRQKLLSAIRTYFRLGGQEIQINATSTDTMIDARKHPENYQDLVVRVSGFSAFYVTLSPEVQDDIMARTQQYV